MPPSHPRRWAPPIALLGVPFDNITTSETLETISRMIESRRPHYLATANVDFVVQAMQDLELRRILNDAHLVLCDGQPLVWASHLLGNPLPERVAGSDLVPLILSLAEKKGYRVFFLGGQPEVTDKALTNVRKQYPNLQIAGSMSPPFAPLLEMNHAAIAKEIRESGVDILLVSFGCPKQEKWLAMNYRHLGVPVSLGVGATIDFLAGAVARAPRWMHGAGLEWVWRLAQEPRRLFKRYIKDLWVFGISMAQQISLLPRMAPPRMELDKDAGRCIATIHSQVVELPRHFRVQTLNYFAEIWRVAASAARPTVLDGSGVATTDSTALAMLLRLQTELRTVGCPLVLSGASPALQRALKILHLENALECTETVAEGLALLRERHKENPVEDIVLDPDRGSTMRWQGEVTARNAPQVWQSVEPLLAAGELRGGGSVQIDLSTLRFVDSTGVGLMVKAKKHGLARGVEVSFAKPSREVSQIVRLLRMDKFLFAPQSRLAAQ